MIGLGHYLTVAAIMFVTGILGIFINRKNVIIILMSLELMLLGNTVQAGISGVGEFVEQIEAGELRALAVSSPEPVELLPDTPTLVDEGYDVTLTNWRGLLAPGDLGEADAEALRTLVTELHDSEAWAATLEEKGWADAFLTGEEFQSFLDGNIAEVTETLQTIGLVAP